MPTYDYFCSSCKKEMEIFQKITENPLKNCPECHKNSLQRIPSAGAGLSFHGKGFYVNDYCKTKHNKNGTEPSKESTACPCKDKT